MALPRVLLYLRGVQTALAVLALALLSYSVHTNVYWSNLGARAAIGIIASILTLIACAVFMFLHLNGNYPAKPLWPVLVDSVLFAVWLGATIQILRSNTYMQDAQNEGDEDVWRPLALRSMGAVGDGKCRQNQARHDGHSAPVVHLDVGILSPRRFPVARDGDERGDAHDKGDDAAEPKVPPPRHVFGGRAAGDDAQKEANRGKGAPQTEDDILPRPGAVCLAEQHDTGGQERSRSQSAQRAGDDEHLVVGAEARDERPDGEPEEPGVEDDVGSVDVGETAKRQQKGAGDEGEDARGPGLGALGDLKGLGDGGQDDVEARDEEFLVMSAWVCVEGNG